MTANTSVNEEVFAAVVHSSEWGTWRQTFQYPLQAQTLCFQLKEVLNKYQASWEIKGMIDSTTSTVLNLTGQMAKTNPKFAFLEVLANEMADRGF